MNEFHKNGYMIIRGLITTSEAFDMSKHLKRRESTEDIHADEQAPLSSSFYTDEYMLKMQLKLLPDIEKHTGLDLFKTYNYARIYKNCSILRIHRDRPACEVSLTLDLGGDPWDLWVLDRDENPHNIHLEPGDALIYRGTDIHHWRGKFEGGEHTQVFMHYVDKYGPCAWAKDDNMVQP